MHAHVLHGRSASRFTPALVFACCCSAGQPLSAQPSFPDVQSHASAPHRGLKDELSFLTVRGPTGPYRLEVAIVRKADAQGRLPVALLTHGKQRSGAEMARMRAELMLPQARDLAHRGFLAVAVVRRGFGRSDGTPGVATNAPYVKCNVRDLHRYFDVESEDLEAALRAIAERPDADGSRVIAIGSSVGGGAVLALAARKPQGLVAAVNIAGGVRLTNAEGEVVCPFDTPIAALASFGASTKIPTLWVYAENDGVFAPDVARKAHEAFKAAGGTAELRIVPALPQDGHHTFELPDGRVRWLAVLDSFLRARGLPTWGAAQVDTILRTARLPTSSRSTIESYLSLYTPKVLVQGPGGMLTYSANTREIARAREAGLAQCQQKARAACKVIMENFGD